MSFKPRGHETERGELVRGRKHHIRQDRGEDDSGNFKDDHEIAPGASHNGTSWGEGRKRRPITIVGGLTMSSNFFVAQQTDQLGELTMSSNASRTTDPRRCIVRSWPNATWLVGVVRRVHEGRSREDDDSLAGDQHNPEPVASHGGRLVWSFAPDHPARSAVVIPG
jgi:hypothetical protein